MNRWQYIAAEMHGYSYDHYQDKIDIRHKRFTKYMPQDIRILEKSLKEGVSDDELAKRLEMDVKDLPNYKAAYQRALSVVDTKNAGEAFKMSLRQTLVNYIEQGKFDKENIDAIIEQILYNTTDFAFLLRREDKTISDYSLNFRYGDSFDD